MLAAGCGASERPFAHSAPPRGDAYVESLVARAMLLGLDQEPQWLRLLHYRESRFGAHPASEADDPRFFLSPRGKFDPRAELAATLRGFFLPAVAERAAGEAGDVRHPLCRFPARFAYLSAALEIDAHRLPQQSCPRYADYLRDINPQSVTLVFSSYYLNNPASAFGHTFLRFNKAQTLAVGERRELLDYAINFSADVDTGNAVLYAFRGVFGLFPGTVKRLPYYYKVREYADTESRDIWEYELDLTPQQLYMLAAHVWEVGQVYFAYYYLDENCSYRILRMLEAALPDAKLSESLHGAVLPVDTIKALFDNPGLVRKVSYRPSLRTQLLHAVEDLSSEQAGLVEELAVDEETPLPAHFTERQRADTLDAALDLVDMRHMKALVFDRDPEIQQRKQRLLERRAQIRLVTPREPIEPPWDRQPQLSHGSLRLGIAPGARAADARVVGGGFVALDLRLAMHDLADPSLGNPELAGLEFLPTRLRAFPKPAGTQLRLTDLSLVRIMSLTPLQRFDLRMSWNFDFGARSLEAEGCEHCVAAKIRGGTGFTLAFFDQAIAAFAFANVSGYLASEPGAGIDGSIGRAGFGPFGGLRLRLDPRLIVLSTAEWMFYPAQPDRRVLRVEASVRLSLSAALALSLEGRATAAYREAELFVLGYL